MFSAPGPVLPRSSRYLGQTRCDCRVVGVEVQKPAFHHDVCTRNDQILRAFRCFRFEGTKEGFGASGNYFLVLVVRIMLK